MRLIHPDDNVLIREDGHKIARREIPAGDFVIKYGMSIGRASERIPAGAWVHSHNLKTELSGTLTYAYAPDIHPLPERTPPMIRAYRRADGRVGIRNDLWVIPTVGCVNGLARRLAARVGGLALTHPYGCSQLGDDHERTADLLAALARHPNAGGVLVVGLGCENNTMARFQERLGDVSRLNIRFLVAQDPGDEWECGCALLDELLAGREKERVEVPVSELVVGLKCGGSDGFSGLTANPLVGRFSDWLVARGGSVVLTEVPEMFGAETLLMRRCVNREVFDRFVRMLNDFKEYYLRNGFPVGENPSPGNRAGGITTLEEKSLGCVQKAGMAPVADVLPYAGRVRRRGLSLLTGPGNDLVAATALAAAGCQMILFTTGRGTPFGTVVPTLKIASNTRLAQSKPSWVDWDAQANDDVEEFAAKILRTVAGEQTQNERTENREIAIFKNGVTL